MERWLERIGYTLQWLSDEARARMEQAGDMAAQLSSDARDMDVPEDAEPALGGSAGVLAGAAGAWLASRLLAPNDVNWTRAVAAGVIGTLLYDATMLADQRLLGRKFDTIGPLGEALTDDPELQPYLGWAAHYAGGVGLALLYARYLHNRLPGTPAVRGAMFGLADAATLTWGGLLPLLSRFAPHVSIPTGYAALAHAPQFTARSAVRHLAYGVGVGVTYRD